MFRHVVIWGYYENILVLCNKSFGNAVITSVATPAPLLS
jgi:hypothetical protein